MINVLLMSQKWSNVLRTHRIFCIDSTFLNARIDRVFFRGTHTI